LVDKGVRLAGYVKASNLQFVTSQFEVHVGSFVPLDR
jgi:hypothetical protein